VVGGVVVGGVVVGMVVPVPAPMAFLRATSYRPFPGQALSDPG